MSMNIIVTVIIIVLILSLFVSYLEYFEPIAVKADMNTYCRNALLDVEIDGALSDQSKTELNQNLLKLGLTNITINSTIAVKQGQEITLDVQADYIYSKLVAVLFRHDELQHMVYTKTTVSRKVVN